MPKLTDDERIREEDYHARWRDFAVQVFEEDRENKIEFYKQIMILSVAGLGFNLSPPIRGGNVLEWFPDSAWEVSTCGFLVAIFATLLRFYLKSWHSSLWSRLIDPYHEAKNYAYGVAKALGVINSILAIIITASFTIGVILAIISLS